MWTEPKVVDWWQREFTDEADPEYNDQIIPLVVDALGASERILDLGTGEGQVARPLVKSGAEVVGIDLTLSQLSTGVERSSDTSYVQSSVAELPFAGNSFDAAFACLVFEHVDEMDQALQEVARVLQAGSKFLLLLNHPLFQTPNSGWIDDQILDPPEQYWRIGSYLPETEIIEEVNKGVLIRFVHRPLSRYINSLANVGLVLERMDEPAPPQSFLDKASEYTAAATVPRLLALHCRKLTVGENTK